MFISVQVYSFRFVSQIQLAPKTLGVVRVPQGTLVMAALGHAKIDFTLRLKVNVNFGMAERCH